MTSKYRLALPAALSVMVLRGQLRRKTARRGMLPLANASDRPTSSIPTKNSKYSVQTCTRPAWLLPAFSRKLLRRWPTSVDIPWRDTDRCSTRSALPHDGEPSLFES
jgi:hypothetical protein